MNYDGAASKLSGREDEGTRVSAERSVCANEQGIREETSMTDSESHWRSKEEPNGRSASADHKPLSGQATGNTLYTATNPDCGVASVAITHANGTSRKS
jgi:uncharacterized protein YfiM (DUF2279 family)